jgi:hypothetical protein
MQHMGGIDLSQDRRLAHRLIQRSATTVPKPKLEAPNHGWTYFHARRRQHPSNGVLTSSCFPV